MAKPAAYWKGYEDRLAGKTLAGQPYERTAEKLNWSDGWKDCDHVLKTQGIEHVEVKSNPETRKKRTRKEPVIYYWVETSDSRWLTRTYEQRKNADKEARRIANQLGVIATVYGGNMKDYIERATFKRGEK